MAKTMVNKKTNQKVKVIEHIILKNFWEYYVLDENNNPDNPDIVTCLVLGAEHEIGDVSLNEIKPYIMLKTNRLNEVMPAPNWEWQEQ